MNQIIELHKLGWGRRRISAELGISEKRVRGILEHYRKEQTNAEAGVKSVKYINGQTIIEAVIQLDDLNDQDALMTACKYDPKAWECVSSEIKAYQSLIKDADSKPVVTNLYSVTVKVKPKKQGLDIDAVLARINRMEPVEILPNPIRGKGLLEVFITDPHRGLDNNYAHLLGAITERAKAVEKVVIVFGGDEIHVDNIKNTTVNGTQLEAIDLNEAWEESYTFNFNLIYQVLRMGKECEVIYIPGNHDATISWTIIKALQKVLPDAKYDTSIEQFKAMRWNGIAIGWTHGDKGKRADFDRLFLKRYPWIFGDAQVCEIHYGHIHQESAKDSFGSMIRSLPTATAQSQWTIDSGYEAAQRFQLFEYSEDSLRAIYYI